MTTNEKKQSTAKHAEVVASESVLPRRLFDWIGWPSLGSRLEALGFDDRLLRVEEFETDGAYIVRAEMPGLDPDSDLDIHVSDHTLHIEAQREEHKETDSKDRYRSEFRYGHFLRRVSLPAGVESGDVKATYKDGILEVRMPVDRKAAASTKVAVQHL